MVRFEVWQARECVAVAIDDDRTKAFKKAKRYLAEHERDGEAMLYERINGQLKVVKP